MTVIYAIPVASVNPDDPTVRALISPSRLELLDRRSGPGRAQGIAATLLLEYAIARRFPFVPHPLALSIAEGGKPHLVAQPGVHFSLSHAGAWAVCAVSDHPVGVDIERREPGRRDIAERFFHKEETRYLNSLVPYMREDAFYSLWVLKEAFVKATGRGLSLPLRSFCVNLRTDPPTLSCEEVGRPYSLALVPFPADLAYRLAVCTEGADAEEPLLEVLE